MAAGTRSATLQQQAHTVPADNAAKEMRGYVITEDADCALKDLSEALDAVAMLCEDRSDDAPEILPEAWGGLLRTFARSARAIHADAAFVNRAIAKPRDLN